MRPLPRSPFVSTRDAVFASARRPSISTRRNRLQERRETAVLYPLPRPEPALMRFGGSVQGLGRPPGQAVEDLLPSSASSRSHFSGMRVHGKESRARPPGAGSSIVGGGARSSLPASATEIRKDAAHVRDTLAAARWAPGDLVKGDGTRINQNNFRPLRAPRYFRRGRRHGLMEAAK